VRTVVSDLICVKTNSRYFDTSKEKDDWLAALKVEFERRKAESLKFLGVKYQKRRGGDDGFTRENKIAKSSPVSVCSSPEKESEMTATTREEAVDLSTAQVEWKCIDCLQCSRSNDFSEHCF
jgi:hypothetical protein